MVCGFNVSLWHKNDTFHVFSHTVVIDVKITKKALLQFADNAGPDQLSHSRRSSWTFIVRLQNVV